jgi:hypothetical protein
MQALRPLLPLSFPCVTMRSMENEFKFIELRAKGWSFDRIAKEINVSKPTLIKWSRKHSVEIENQRQLEMDLLRETLKLDRRSRFNVMSSIISKLESRISAANFDELPLEKALAAWVKYNEMFLCREEKVTLEGEFDISALPITTQWSG